MKKILIVIIIIIFCLFLYGKYIEINNFKIKEYTIYNSIIPESFKELKIVHFSDILYKKNDNKDRLEKLTDEVNKQNADIIIFSGDLFTKNEEYTVEDINNIKECLKKMEASLFKFAVIGDNDRNYLDKYKDVLYECDFTLLDNENKLIFYKDITPINIVGLSSLENIDSLLITDVEYKYSIAIIHEPDYFTDLSKYNINTVISGHSIGGIINIPFYGGIVKKEGSSTYINDYYNLNNTEIFISNGLGYEKFDFRLFNTPSINVYRFSN